jgi:DNA-binding SARP family transcriptional activator
MSEAVFVIRLLGVVQIEQGGSAVHGFESRKALALICYLAALGQPVPRARLVDLFWGDRAEELGRANLSRVLHNDGLLLPGCLQTTRGEASFRRGPAAWVDVVAFAQLAATGDLASLSAAAELYRGDFMDGVCLDGCPEFETWLVTQQELWRQHMAGLLGRLIGAHSERGEYGRALAYAQHLLGLDSWREEAHRHVMLLQALTGQRSAALAQFEVCRRVLAGELGVEPSLQTRELYERIRAGRGSSHPAQQPRPKPALTTAPLPSPDHEKRLAQIAARLDHPACRLLVLTGAGETRRHRLALLAAERRSGALCDGVCDVNLGAAVTSETLGAALAAALQLPEAKQAEARGQLFAHLADKELLLVVRNFAPEDGAVRLLEDILKRAPGVQMLVTAPQPLDFHGEWLLEVEG